MTEKWDGEASGEMRCEVNHRRTNSVEWKMLHDVYRYVFCASKRSSLRVEINNASRASLAVTLINPSDFDRYLTTCKEDRVNNFRLLPALLKISETLRIFHHSR